MSLVSKAEDLAFGIDAEGQVDQSFDSRDFLVTSIF